MSRQVTAIEFCVSKERVGNESVYTNRFALVSITNTVRVHRFINRTGSRAYKSRDFSKSTLGFATSLRQRV